MPSIFSLIAASWAYYRKQPVLNWVLVWMLVLPQFIMNILTRMEQGSIYPMLGRLPDKKLTILLVLPAMFLLALIEIWGTACILVACRRIIQSRAGRARTAFATLRKESSSYIVPLLFTGILRSCFIIFWSILLIIPGVIYSIRTIFYPVIIVSEDIAYREALKRSQMLVKGRTWRILWIFLALPIILLLPSILITIGMEALLPYLRHAWVIPVIDLLKSILFCFPAVLIIIAQVELFVAIKKLNPIHVDL